MMHKRHSIQSVKPFLFSVFFLFLSTLTFWGQERENFSSGTILLELNKLYPHPSVLYIAAHPDDENTRLIPYLTKKLFCRVAYLSLTRGSGGQNLIGDEKGVELGLIRTQELLAARRMDGGEQFFSRAHDFGYSKSSKETLSKWNTDSILQDIVFVIRYFKPDVIITRFNANSYRGHGHHTSSAILAEKAFDLAGNRKVFPEQLRYVKEWKPKRLLHNSTLRFFNPNANMTNFLPLDVGDYQPLLGVTTGEIASFSRSMHKSQGFAVPKSYGKVMEYFLPLKGDTSHIQSPLQGIITKDILERNKESIDRLNLIIKKFDPKKPETILNDLIQLHKIFLKNKDDYRKKITEKLILAVCGIKIFWLSKNEYAVAGQDNPFLFKIIQHSNQKICLDKISYTPKDKNISHPVTILSENKCLEKNQLFKLEHTLFFHSDNISQPYWLSQKPLFTYAITDISHLKHPDEQRLKTGSITLHINGYTLDIQVPFSYLKLIPEKGEIEQPLHIVPPVSVKFVKKNINLSPLVQNKIDILLKSNTNNIQSITLDLKVPQTWEVSSNHSNRFLLPGLEARTLSFFVKPDKRNNVPQAPLSISAKINDKIFSQGLSEIDYDHIHKQVWFPKSSVNILTENYQKINKKRIAYIMGSGDEIPGVLKEIGYQLDFISSDDLESVSLSPYSSIILGIRVFNVYPLLFRFKQKLWNYVKKGGTLLIQYNTNNWLGKIKDPMTPFYFRISRNRVTDEKSPFQFLLPKHKVFHYPFSITKKDFDGWVQERGIYFSDSSSSDWVKPLALKDFDGNFDNGSILISQYGKGLLYIAEYLFFRQIPAGVEGALKLFVNLIEYKPMPSK